MRSYLRTLAEDDVKRPTQAPGRQVRPFEAAAACMLPPNRYSPISSDSAAMLKDGVDEMLSAAQPATMVRFRADATVGTRITLVLRLAAYDRDFRIRICSGSGAESDVFLAGGSEKIVVLSCEVEPGRLITAHLSVVGAPLEENESSDAGHWMLRGILYFDPRRVAGERSNQLNGGHGALSSARRSSPPQSDSVAFANIALTYGNDRLMDGAGAQLQRIYGVYAISRFLKFALCPLTSKTNRLSGLGRARKQYFVGRA
jgi:hypothetical protein